MDLDEILGATKYRNALCHAVFAGLNWIFEICWELHPPSGYTQTSFQKALNRTNRKKGGCSSVTTYRDFGVIGRLVSGMKTNVFVINSSGWWFQIFFIFTPIWGRFPFWPIFFRWVETTNQSYINSQFFIAINLLIPKGWYLGGGNSNVFFVLTPILGVSWSNLTSIFFQIGWFNHQLDIT